MQNPSVDISETKSLTFLEVLVTGNISQATAEGFIPQLELRFWDSII